MKDKRVDPTISKIETVFWPREESPVKKILKVFESKKRKEKESIEKETAIAFWLKERSTDKETWIRSESESEKERDDTRLTIERVVINEIVSTTNEIVTVFCLKEKSTDKET